MSLSYPKKPDALDRQNYSSANPENRSDRPFNKSPEKFLSLGQRVRAKIRVWDMPNNEGEGWGWVSAEKGETGTCIHKEPDGWPTVQFDYSGCLTDVTDIEVEPIDPVAQRKATASFFLGLGQRLRNPDAKVQFGDESEAYRAGWGVADGFLKDVETGSAPGIALSDMVEVALRELKY